MGALSDYLENKLADQLFRGVAYTFPATFYIGLYTSAPTDAGGGTEVSGGSYARVAVTVNTTNWSAASGGSLSNAAAITFAAATAAWGTVTHIGIFDALTSGNLLIWGALASSRVVNISDQFSFAVGQLVVSFD
jgi:hypothetical protein